jgi:hypothetical protein
VQHHALANVTQKPQKFKEFGLALQVQGSA